MYYYYILLFLFIKQGKKPVKDEITKNYKKGVEENGFIFVD